MYSAKYSPKKRKESVKKTSPNLLNMDPKSFDERTCNTEEILKLKPRLQVIRQKALNVLETCSRNETSLNKPLSGSSETDNKSKSKSINISDIIAEKTIVLDSPVKSDNNNEILLQERLKTRENEISFKPSEITGRSTLFKQAEIKSNLTVEDILASSFCDKVRLISMSEKKSSDILPTTSFQIANSSNDFKISESFKPGELMTSQLLRDELSWGNYYLPIPNSEAIEQTIEKIDSYSSENSIKGFTGLSNISDIGNYFYKRSDQLESIINPNILSPPKRNPVKLVTENSVVNCTFHKENNNISMLSSTKSLSSNNSQQQFDGDTSAFTMPTVEKVLQQLHSNKMITRDNEPLNTNFVIKKSLDRKKVFEKENVPFLATSNENDTITFTESLLDDSNCSNLIISRQFFKESRNSTLCAERSFKNKSSSHSLTETQPVKKCSKSANGSVAPEVLSVTKSLSSTLRNGIKYKNFLDVDDKIQPPISPIRSKSVTPQKSQRNVSTGNSSPNKSPRLHSTLSSISSKSPLSPNTTTKSDRQYLCINEEDRFKCVSQKTKSPCNAELVPQQYIAGSLVLAKSRCNSQCSTTSEFIHRDGQSLPIKATFNLCSFGAVKLRKSVKKNIGIRNASIKRLSFKVGIEGPGFQIENMEKSSIVVLQGQECRTFSIIFYPTVLGPAIGKLSFSPPYDGWSIDKVIPLQGYGGHASMKVRDFEKGPMGPPFINMGEVQELSQPLIKSFSVYNRGPLGGFAVINLNSTGLAISSLCEHIQIEPKAAYIPPESNFKFRIIFHPCRNDIKKILTQTCDVITIANIRIITGDESTRQRIRNIVKTNENELPELTQSKLSNCWSDLPNETTLSQLNNFVENPDIALELVSDFRDWEAVLTITNFCMENTKNFSSLIFPDLDETILFRTMISANSKSHKNSVIEDDSKFVESFTVRPNVIRFDQIGSDKKAMFTIKSFFQIEEHFEVVSNYKNLFNIYPKEGKILPGETIEVEVNVVQHGFAPVDNVNIIVYFEHEKVNIPVILTKN